MNELLSLTERKPVHPMNQRPLTHVTTPPNIFYSFSWQVVCVPGTVLSGFCVSSHLILQTTLRKQVVLFPFPDDKTQAWHV